MFFFFFFNDTATTEIYTLSLHDALPIYGARCRPLYAARAARVGEPAGARQRRAEQSRESRRGGRRARARSEEHTSELQSLRHLVCRLLLEKKKNKNRSPPKSNSNRDWLY